MLIREFDRPASLPRVGATVTAEERQAFARCDRLGTPGPPTAVARGDHGADDRERIVSARPCGVPRRLVEIALRIHLRFDLNDLVETHVAIALASLDLNPVTRESTRTVEEVPKGRGEGLAVLNFH